VIPDLAIPPRPSQPSTIEEVCTLPNGCTLFREANGAGGHTYYSDEVGEGVMVWDTCLVSQITLLAAITQENMANYREAVQRDRLRGRAPEYEI